MHRGRRAGFPVVPPHGFFPHYPNRGGFFASDPEAVRLFPTDGAGFSSAYPTLPLPTSLWGLQEDAGATTLTDGIGGVTLTRVNSGNAGVLGDPTGRKAVSLVATNSRWQAANNTLLDPASGSLTVFARCFVPITGLLGAILEKKVSGTTGVGYSLLKGSTNQISFDADGGFAASPNPGIVQSGQWIDLMGVVDRTAGEVRQYSTLGSATLPIGAMGSLTTTLIFCIGDPSGINSLNGTLVSYAAVWIGSALTIEQFNKLRGV